MGINENGANDPTRCCSTCSARAGENAPRVLLAEDDEEMRRMLASAFRTYGFRVTECADGFGLLEALGTSLFRTESLQYDVVVSDVRMPGLTGLDIMKSVRQKEGVPPIVLITAFGDDDTHAEAESLGVAVVLDKPFRIERLLEVVQRVMGSSSRP